MLRCVAKHFLHRGNEQVTLKKLVKCYFWSKTLFSERTIKQDNNSLKIDIFKCLLQKEQLNRTKLCKNFS